METLIELYDERPLENVLGVEMFRPQRVVYICPEELAGANGIRKRLHAYFEYRGLDPELIFVTADTYHTEAVLQTMRNTLARYPNASIDITGGTDAVLFAAGLLSAETDVPVFTYSRRMNRFYDIRNAAFAHRLHCDVRYTVEDLVKMAGGSLRRGRVDNAVLKKYRELYLPFFHVYLANRRKWNRIVTYIQRISAWEPGAVPPLDVEGAYTVKGERGGLIDAPEEALYALSALGMVEDLTIEPGVSVSFRFRDAQIRTWLRDVGSVLELYVYQTCAQCGLFNDVILSAMVDWEPTLRANAVTNELDVMATRAVSPVFISCKTPLLHTEALNELAILRDRFGGQMAKAAIVTGERAGAPVRNRASELNIAVVDLDDLANGRLESRIRSLVK